MMSVAALDDLPLMLYLELPSLTLFAGLCLLSLSKSLLLPFESLGIVFRDFFNCNLYLITKR